MGFFPFFFLHWVQNFTFKGHGFKQNHGVWWSVWNWTPVWSDLCNTAGSDLQSQKPYRQVFQSIINTHDNTLKWTNFWMFSKYIPKHKVCQVYQGCDYTRIKPAQELELIVPCWNQGRYSKGSADQCIGKTKLGSLPESLLLTSFVSLLLVLDLKFIVIKRELRYLRATYCLIKATQGKNSHRKACSLCLWQVLVYKTSAYL